MDYVSVQEASAILILMKNIGSILITSAAFLEMFKPLPVGALVGILHLDFSCVVSFRAYLHGTKLLFDQVSSWSYF